MGKGGGCGASKVVRAPSVTAQPIVQEEDDEAYWHLYVPWTSEDSTRIEPPRPKTSEANGRTRYTGAVRLSFLLDFVTKKTTEPEQPTWSVVLNVVQPATAGTDWPYTALPHVAPHVLPYGSPTPYYFVSHAWSRPLAETARCLQHHFRDRDPQDVFVWLDVFAIPQRPYTPGEEPTGPDVTMVDAVIAASGGVLLCLDEAGTALRRTWCLYEAWRGAAAPTAPQAAAAGAGGGKAGGAAAAGSGAAAAGPGGPVGLAALMPRALLPEERARLFSKIDIRQSRCKLRLDRDSLLDAARSQAAQAAAKAGDGGGGGGGGLDRVNHTLRVALMLRPLVPDVAPELHPGRITQVRELWDMGPVDAWLTLPESDPNCQALVLYGAPGSGKSTAAAAVAAHLAGGPLGLPVAAHYCSATDARTLDPLSLVLSLALQLSCCPRLGPRLLRTYGALPPGLLADLASGNGSPGGLEAAVEGLLVAPLQRLLQPDGGEEDEDQADGDAASRPAHNEDLRQLGPGCDEDAEAAQAADADGKAAAGGGMPRRAAARSMRAPPPRFEPPKAVILVIDGLDQADGAAAGGSAPHDNQILQLIEEHLPKLPSFVRLVLTSRPHPHIAARLASNLAPRELPSPELLRAPKPFARNLRLALGGIDPGVSRRQRSAAASALASRARGSVLFVKLALCCLQRERQLAAWAGEGTGWQLSLMELPADLPGLMERYLELRMRLLGNSQQRRRVGCLLALLAAAREPLTEAQLAVALAALERGAAAAAVPAPPPSAADHGYVAELACGGLGALVRFRPRPDGGWGCGLGLEVALAHPEVAEWLQSRPANAPLPGCPGLLLDLPAAHLALATACRADLLRCLDGGGRRQPHAYTVRHLFTHAGLAALAAVGTAARPPLAAAAGWPGSLESLLLRMDVWSSVYAAGAGASARWAVCALASLPGWDLPSADPAAAAATAAAEGAAAAGVPPLSLRVALAEARRWLLLQHGQMVWYPLGVVTAASCLPEESVMRGRALEYSAGPDPWVVDEEEDAGVAPAAPEPGAAPGPALAGGGGASPGGNAGGAGRHLVLLSPGQRWSGCVAALRTEAGRVLHVAVHPGGRMLATVQAEGRGILVWDPWDGRQLGVMDGSYGMGAHPTPAFFTPDGTKLVCAARSIFVWDVATGRLLMELNKAARRAAPRPSGKAPASGGAPRASVKEPPAAAAAGAPRPSVKEPAGAASVKAAAAVAEAAEAEAGGEAEGAGPDGGDVDVLGGGGVGVDGGVVDGAGDPEGPVVVLAMSPDGTRVAAGHASGTSRVWELSSGRLQCATWMPQRRPVTALAFSAPAGATLLVAHGEGGGAAPAAVAPVGREELADVPTALIKADDLTLHVWKIVGGSPKELEVLKGHTGKVTSLVFSTYDGNMVTGSVDETVRTWWDDPKTPQSDYRQVFILGGAGQGPVHAVAFSPAPPSSTAPPARPPPSRGGALRAMISRKGDAKGAAPAAPAVADATYASLAGAGMGSAAGAAAARDAAAAAAVAAAAAAAAGGTATAVPPSGNTYVGNKDPYASDGAAAACGAANAASAAAGSGDADVSALNTPIMAYACGDGIVRLWSPRAQRQVGCLRGLAGPVVSLGFSGDGRLLAVADSSEEGVVRVFDVGGACPAAPLSASPSTGRGGVAVKHPVEAMALSPDCRRVALVCADPEVEALRVVDTLSGRKLAVMGPGGGQGGKATAVAWSQDGSRVATGSDDTTVRVWFVAPPPGGAKDGSDAAAAPAAAEAQGTSASADADSEEGEGDAPSALPRRPGCCQLVLSGHHRKVQCLAWAHRGDRLASGGYDQMIRIWDTATGEQLVLIYQVSWVSALAFSPDDARLVSGGVGRAVYLFNSTTGKQLAGQAEAGGGKGAGEAGGGEAGGEETWVVGLSFNPDGTLLAVRDQLCSVGLWDVSGLRCRPLRGLEGAFREALFCPARGDLLLMEVAASGALVVHALPATSLPLGRSEPRSVAPCPPGVAFRGRAADTAANHCGAVRLSADNRAFFFATGAQLAVLRRQEMAEARDGGGRRRPYGGGGEASAAVSRVGSMR